MSIYNTIPINIMMTILKEIDPTFIKFIFNSAPSLAWEKDEWNHAPNIQLYYKAESLKQLGTNQDNTPL